MIQVYTLQLNDNQRDTAFLNTLIAHLPEAGKLRVKDRQNPGSILHTVAGELLARFSVARFIGHAGTEINLTFGEKGKPHISNLSNIHFNISHSGNYVVCAVSEKELGIDVERIRKVNLRVAERFFSPSEISDLMAQPENLRMHYFITLWTIKESYLKAIGKGLSQPLNSFTIVKAGNSYQLTGNQEAEQYCIETQQLSPEYMMAVCSLRPFEEAEKAAVDFEELQSFFPFYP